GRRIRPRRELELAFTHREDRAERGDGQVLAVYRGDDLALGDAERALARCGPQAQLAGLLRVGQEPEQRVEREFGGAALEAHRSATSVCLSKTWSLRRSRPIRSVAPGRVCVSVDTRAV